MKAAPRPAGVRPEKFCAALLLFGIAQFSAVGAEPLPDGLYAEVTTPRGVVIAELHYKQAPMTVANYVGLAEGTLGPDKDKPFYDGLTFHRVVEDFVVQGGDPTGSGEGGPGYAFPDEIVPGLRHDRAGVVQMANDGPDTNGSQWCFMLRPVPRLNYLHSVFGHVVRGLDILPQIRQGDTMKVKILRVGPDAEAFRVTKESFVAQTAAAKKYTGATQPGPDAPFNDPDHLLPSEWDRARSFNFKLGNFERFTGRRLCARVLAKTPEGGIDRYLRETAKRLGTDRSGALVVYCADTGQWRCWLGEKDRSVLTEDASDTESPGESRKAEEQFFADARRSADEAAVYAQAHLPAGETLTTGQKLKLSVDAVLDGLIFKLEPTPGADFVKKAAQGDGEFAQRAATFLVESMPAQDRQTLSADFLMSNLRLALEARTKFPWAASVPEELFFNDVLPYAVLDETREPWREQMLPLAERLVKNCRSASEAAQALNRELFNALKVHYNTSRQRPNQSPSESIAQGRATCTGLAILLVDACRAVGIPARVAGVAEWTHKPGNHTWVEIWDGEWKFLGADEYDAKGLNRGWFVEDASKAGAADPLHAVWASSWKTGDGHFPMAWDTENKTIAAVNVTDRYAAAKTPTGAGRALVHLRVTGGGERIVVMAELLDAGRNVIATQTTKAGTADLNDMASFPVEPGRYIWRLSRDHETRETPLLIDSPEEQIVDLRWEALSPLSLTKEQATKALEEAWQSLQHKQLASRTKELEARSFSVGDKNIHWAERVHGEKPTGGYSLWISLHGGGNAPPEVNDAQFRNQIDLYKPDEGIWVVPRAPTNTWNLWHEPHIDPMFDRIIEDYIVARGANPNRVYLLGYSAGGDGVYQLAPRMADRLAAAAMMAGHPNESLPLGLRNLPFAIFVGGADAGYNRNQVAREWGDRLDALQKSDPAGYTHWTQIYPGLGHWMDRRDAEALPWMAKFTRDPWPRKIVWHQDDVTHDRFYWLALPKGAAKKDQTITAEVEGQTIRISAEGANELGLRLSDALLDLDRPVTVIVNGKSIFQGQVTRTREAIEQSLAERADVSTAAVASLKLKW